MAESSPSFSQETEFGSFDFLNLPDTAMSTSDSFSFSPAISQAQSSAPEFPPPSHPYELHQQQTDVFDWSDPFAQIEPETSSAAASSSLYFSEPLSQKPIVSMPRQSTSGRFQVHPGYHQAQQQQQAMLQRASEAQQPMSLRDQQINRILEGFVVAPNPAVLKPPSENLPHIARAKKEQEEMDDDERLLASEEGKKLSSRERRQLRNKVSARAFRSRRKEYISQLESEVQKKTYESELAKDHVARLQQEVNSLRNLTKTLLQHEAFQDYLASITGPLLNEQNATTEPPVEEAPASGFANTIAPARIETNNAPKLAWGAWEQPNALIQRPNVF